MSSCGRLYERKASSSSLLSLSLSCFVVGGRFLLGGCVVFFVGGRSGDLAAVLVVVCVVVFFLVVVLCRALPVVFGVSPTKMGVHFWKVMTVAPSRAARISSGFIVVASYSLLMLRIWSPGCRPRGWKCQSMLLWSISRMVGSWFCFMERVSPRQNHVCSSMALYV